MATTKPRLPVTLEPDTYALLRELSELQGESMSKLVAGVLDASLPTLTNLLKAARKYSSLSASAQSEMLARWDAAELSILPHVRAVEAEFGLLSPQVDPRPVTRGSSTPTPISKHRSKGAQK